MKPDKVFILLSIIGILLLIILLSEEKPIIQGKISKIKSDKVTTIYIEDFPTKIIITEKIKFNLTRDNILQIYGKETQFEKMKIIFPDKVICVNC